MKKILYVTTVSRTINAFLVPHIEKLINDGYTVDCACYIDKPIGDSLIKKGVKVYDIPFTRNPLNTKNITAYKRLVDIQEKENYDIVHVHTPVASVYGRLLKSKFQNLKTIYTVHGFHFYKGAPFINWAIYYPIEKIMSKFTDSIITINNEDYERAKSFGIDRVYKADGVGLDLDYYSYDEGDRVSKRESLNLKVDDFVILMIAEVNKNKNHVQMIKAIKSLKDRDIDVKVICAGDGVLFDDVKAEVEKLALGENIQMLGFRSDINELIGCCDVGMLLSYREGLPRNIMELMAYKKPVIGTNIRGIRDLVVDGENGFLVKVGDFEYTASAIETLYDDRVLLGNMSESAYDSVKKYSVDNVVYQLEEVY